MSNQRIQNFLVKQERTGFWIGAYQPASEEDWRWSDCTPWNWTMWDLEFHNGKQPDYASENCVMIWYHDGNWYDKWHNVPCSWTKSFVCSKKMCEGTATTCKTPEKGRFHTEQTSSSLILCLCRIVRDGIHTESAAPKFHCFLCRTFK